MSAPKGQSRTGTGFTSGGKASSKGSASSLPSGARKVGVDYIPGGDGGTTAGNSGGRLEGQNLRGYVHNASRSGLPQPQDATKSPDGSSRVRRV